MELDAEPGSATANSFLTVEEADDILSGRPSTYTTAWFEDADDDDKAAALIWATTIIGARTCWTGGASLETQALTWPRIGMTNRNGFAIPEDVVPYELKVATAELALKLLSADLTADNDASAQGLKRVKAGPVEVEWKDEVAAAALPGIVQDYLVPSWLCPVVTASSPTPFLFEAL